MRVATRYVIQMAFAIILIVVLMIYKDVQSRRPFVRDELQSVA